MIAAVFVLVLALVIGVSSLMGGGAAVQVSQSVPWWALMAVVLAFVAFFAGGVYIGAALAGDDLAQFSVGDGVLYMGVTVQ